MKRATSPLLAALLACGCFSAVAWGSIDRRQAAELSLSGVADTLDQVLQEVQEQVTAPQSVQQFLTAVLGRNWPDSLPAAWSAPSFDWSRLGDFEYSSFLSDFLDSASLHNLTAVQSVRELAQAVHGMEDSFCTPEKFTPSTSVHSSCTGPSVSLAITPKTCVLEGQAKQVVCSPAKLVLTKTPGSCTHKYDAPLSWVGKVCKLSGSVGLNDSAITGGGQKVIPLAHLVDLSELRSSLLR
ncbi:hypothetical protein ABPG77_000088 [Micractinium sp. CCAP 211/92]